MNWLEEQLATRIIGFYVDKQGQVFSKTILSYFLLLWAYYSKRRMNLQLFKMPWLSFLIKGGKQTFLHTKAACLLITKEILLKITKHQPTNGNKLNINATPKVA